ncbi:MAG: protein-glutamate O-methyltransferase CheR [Planctomycetaceae bacterium]|nr:protein-glutamate O-methyltransferase CheR [Planctomycetaceae bacterium]
MNEPSALPSTAAEDLLRRWIGLDPHSIGEAAIRRAVRLRMLSLGIDDVQTFVRLVETDRTQRDRLVEEVVVAESWFFRDHQVYDHLRRFVAARITARPSDPVRILSAPCAAGEEPYSIAMSLLDSGLQPEQFCIDAIDISRVALSKAQTARYSTNAFRNADSGFRDRWFRMDGGSAVLDESVSRCIRFAWANILEESFVTGAIDSGSGPYDVVFCRNLLIYLTTDARLAVERSIDRLLKDDGIVVLGAAEPAILQGNWVADSAGSTFTLRRGVSGERSRWPSLASRSALSAPRRPTPTLPPPNPAPSYPAPAPPQASPSRLPPPVDPPAPVALSSTSTTSADLRCEDSGGGSATQSVPLILADVNALANARRFSEAIALCESAQRDIGPSAELYFIAGIMHQTSGSLAIAEDCFHKTLYLDASHDEALLALSLLAEQRGDSGQAAQYRRSALRVVERKGDR